MSGWVYMMASRRNGTIYTGVTSDLRGRAQEHKDGTMPGFTSRYGCKNLVWYERHDNIVEAIAREKKLKKYRRAWKLELIEGFNPDWLDLLDRCYERDNPSDAIRARQDGMNM
ncbi:MAG: GIY-YIG nuclease family protein [Roseitalea sp.]|nr:GIY-YIG nuclease family protein [Roseitalea sp.]MBO6722242.1 GIY-YIG nuclease family protein [Roseitalea sp.]MBO6744966.1 GIY-YIG nuclease family protein [Roseitalea sp.]